MRTEDLASFLARQAGPVPRRIWMRRYSMAIYCFHCPEMEIPFIAIWYVAGMAIPTVLGALMGPKILRW